MLLGPPIKYKKSKAIHSSRKQPNTIPVSISKTHKIAPQSSDLWPVPMVFSHAVDSSDQKNNQSRASGQPKRMHRQRDNKRTHLRFGLLFFTKVHLTRGQISLVTHPPEHKRATEKKKQ